MGRWSEFKVGTVCQEKERARWAEHKDRSGEDGWAFVGTRVGDSSLRRQRLLPFKASSMASPLRAALRSRVLENQEGLWALKSPTRMESLWRSKRSSKLGE